MGCFFYIKIRKAVSENQQVIGGVAPQKNEWLERLYMNREFLRNLGIADDAIDSIMAEHSKSINTEKQKAEGYKTDSIKLTELTKQLEAMKTAQADKDKDLENKDSAYEELKKQFDGLQKELKNKELKAQLAEKGITGENADKLIASLGDGTLDVELLGAIMTDRESTAVTNKVKELSAGATNPNGGKASSADTKTDAEKLAESIGDKLAETNKQSSDVLAQYI